ncbi:MAG: AMP-binding protein [Lysobacterales bacterium]|jgi:long-subunit acyl-CoA synthetase (AMP-forming)
MQRLKSPLPLGNVTPNVGSMLLNNRDRYPEFNAFAERRGGEYVYWSWSGMVRDVLKLAGYVVAREGPLELSDEDTPANRVAFISANGYHRLVAEMAVMATGRAAVPVFAGYAPELMSELVAFGDVGLLVSDNLEKIAALSPECLPRRVLALNGDRASADPGLLEKLRTLGVTEVTFIEDLLATATDNSRLEAGMREVPPERLALIMFTSGTSSFPKGVQLTHANLLSQQKALEILWQPQPGMRFLCYLPWHHSFGGLFERFFALHSGGCLAIDDSFGKDAGRLLQNFAEIRPHVYFSVPKVYQEIVSRILAEPSLRERFFHPDLQFVFTAAAPLPLSTSEIFRSQGVPVVEGWGLTETSPCCTLTERSLERTPGVVGFPIPGVEIKLGDEHEILVRGPNVMRGYYRQPEATAKVFTDGWFHTGDVGEVTAEGVRIISRLDRMFKLDNGEKVFPARIEDRIAGRCKFIKYAYVFGSGQKHPSLLAFPNRELMGTGSGGDLDTSDCVYPGCSHDLAGCLGECIRAEQAEGAAFERVEGALVVDAELSVEANQLTPSFKLIPRKIEEDFKRHIEALRKKKPEELPPDASIIDMERE